MRSFEVIPPEAHCPGSCLQPKRSGAAPIQEDSECIPSDPHVVVAEVNPFSFPGRGFKRSVHTRVPGLKFSRNSKRWLCADLDRMRLDDGPHIFSGTAFVSTSPRRIVFEARKTIRAAVAKGVGVENPAEKTAVRPNQKIKGNDCLYSPRNGTRFRPHNRPAHGERWPRASWRSHQTSGLSPCN